jgi:hypothetical protein
MPHCKLSVGRLPTVAKTLDRISDRSHQSAASLLQLRENIVWIVTSKIIACVLMEANST